MKCEVIDKDHHDAKKIQGYLRLAYQYAWNESDDPSTKNAALIVRRHYPLRRATGDYNLTQDVVVAIGANKLPEGVVVSLERLKRPAKYDYMGHAEQGAVQEAAFGGRALQGTEMYCPWAACPTCAIAIINAGIAVVVTHYNALAKSSDVRKAFEGQDMVDGHRTNWKIEEAAEMMSEAGVKFIAYKGEIGGCRAMFDEKEWAP